MHLSIIEDLTTVPIVPKSNVLVEFETDSQMYNVSLLMDTDWSNRKVQ